MLNETNTIEAIGAPTSVEPQSRADQIVGLIHEITKVELDASSFRHQLLSDRRQTLQADLSWQPCTSPVAAMLKICIVKDEFDRALNSLAGTPDDAQMALVERNCGSVIRWIEKQFGVSRIDHGLDFFHSDRGERSAWGLEMDDDGSIPS